MSYVFDTDEVLRKFDWINKWLLLTYTPSPLLMRKEEEEACLKWMLECIKET